MAEGFEYLDHTADIQLHAWAPTQRRAFELVAQAMFGYITDLEHVEETGMPVEVEATGHDMESLLYSFLDELLFQFNGDYFVVKRVVIDDFDTGAWRIRATGHGETFDRAKHTPGTEIKAITYSAMQIHTTAERCDVFVIVDI